MNKYMKINKRMVAVGVITFSGLLLSACSASQTGNAAQDSQNNTTDSTTQQQPDIMTQTTSTTSVVPGNKTESTDPQLQKDEQNIQNSLNQLQQDQDASNQDTNTQALSTPQQ